MAFRFAREDAGVNSSYHGEYSALPVFLRYLIASPRLFGHDADADDVERFVEINQRDSFVDQANMFFRRRARGDRQKRQAGENEGRHIGIRLEKSLKRRVCAGIGLFP